MDKFPKSIHIINKKKFCIFYKHHILLKLREHIFEHILKNSEEDYFDLDSFCLEYLNKDMDIMHELIKIILSELKELGWKSKLSFGNTGLFIYSTDNPPKTCWDGDFN